MIDMRTGALAASCRRKAVLLATGGGPTMYKYHTPSGDKTCDGLAMALRAGLPLARHGDGAVPPHGPARRPRHAHDRHGAGGGPARRRRLPARRQARALHGRLRCARRARDARHRLALDLRPRCARAARRRTAASTSRWGISGRTTCARSFKGMVERCADCGFDLAGGLVEVVPTAHYMMGGVVFGADCATDAAPASSPPARTPAACTARTASAATASPTRPCSAASPATRWRAMACGAPGRMRDPDEAAIEAELEHARGAASARRAGDLNADPRARSTT